MLKVYTRINGKMAQYDVDTDDIQAARDAVNRETGNIKKDIPVMVLVPINEKLNRYTKPLFA